MKGKKQVKHIIESHPRAWWVSQLFGSRDIRCERFVTGECGGFCTIFPDSYLPGIDLNQISLFHIFTPSIPSDLALFLVLFFCRIVHFVSRSQPVNPSELE